MFATLASAMRARCHVSTILLAATAVTAGAQEDSTRARRDTAQLGAVTVIGSRDDILEARDRMLTIPGGVAMVTPSEMRATRQANLHDVLRFTPGVYVQPRLGAADESQLSIRGSGLRNNFHARGVNLLVNGMPYRNADGFTDFESLEMLTTEAVEVYKGANALRYGGSTLGGAINMLTQTGITAPPLTVYLQGGAFGFLKGQLAAAGMGASTDWYGSYARTKLGGYRDWSEQQRDRVSLHGGVRANDRVDVRTFYLFARVDEQLPGSLTRAELASTPGMAVPGNVTNKWGRHYNLHHLGAQLRAQLTPHQRLEVSPYMQYRDVDHPIFEIITQITRDVGFEARYENTAPLFGHANRLTIGIQPALESMTNHQYRNVGGTRGTMTKDEYDRAETAALYAESALDVSARVTATAGLRAEQSARQVNDRLTANGNQSGDRTFNSITPRAGLVARLSSRSQAFANVSRTVEPPLLLELTSFGNPGGFLPLEPQSAWQYELGARSQALGLAWEVSLYDIEIEHELLNQNVKPFPAATFTVPTYRNSEKTRHAGLEAGVAFNRWLHLITRGDVRDALSGRVSYTFNRFTYVEDPAFTGHDIPGAPRHYVSAEVKYQHPAGFSVAPSLEWVPGSYFLNSENTERNSAWHNVGFRAEWLVSRLATTVFLTGQNLTDTKYSGSVQVDNAAGRYFEPSDPRSFYLGARWTR
jgi:iron complex outermembrane recepter protein